MRYITLIRHGVTEWNMQGRVQGRTDVPLADKGRRQAEALAPRFADKDFLLFSSPLSRAMETAKIAFPNYSIREEPRLRELHFGIFEGQTLAERQADAAWLQWQEESFEVPAPGGESYADVRLRVADWLLSLPADKHIVAVTHSGVIRSLLAYVAGVERSSRRRAFVLEHTGLSVLMEQNDEVLIERVNDAVHLKPELDIPARDVARLEP